MFTSPFWPGGGGCGGGGGGGGYQEGWHWGNKELLVSIHTAEYDAHPSYLISNILDGFIAEGHLCLTAPLTCLAV